MWSNGFSRALELRPTGRRRPAWLRSVAGACAGLVPALGREAKRWPIGSRLLGTIERLRRNTSGTVLGAVALPSGEWRLELGDGRCVAGARLTAYWIAGPWAGLAWRSTDRRTYVRLLYREQLDASVWRRLRVRLRYDRPIA